MVEQLLLNLKNSPVAILLGLVVVLLSSLITVSTAVSLLLRYYQSTLGQKRKLCRELDRLSAGVSIEYFRGILGAPVFVSLKGERRESIFINKYFYVQAITDSQDCVLIFSVTTRTKRFNPNVILGPYTIAGRPARVALGKTRFSELASLSHSPYSISSNLGARRFDYYEAYSFGNPGHYQTYVFAVNGAGCEPWPRFNQWDSFDEPKISDGWNSIENPEVATFRKRAVINTYAITSPLLSLEELGMFCFGPEYDLVRIVD